MAFEACRNPSVGAVQTLTKRRHRLRGIRAERAQWAMQRGKNRAESGVLQAAALQDDHIPTSVLSVSDSEQTEGEQLTALGNFEPFPFRHGSRRDTFPARGDSFWLALPPACPERGGGHER